MIEIVQSTTNIYISQMKYALDIQKDTYMLDCMLVDSLVYPNNLELYDDPYI